MSSNKQQKEVELFLSQCGLLQYFKVFIEEGFERIESLLEITESDLIQMQVKRGHRRLLQRAVANAKGIPSNVPLNIGTTAVNYNIGADPNASSPPLPPASHMNITTNHHPSPLIAASSSAHHNPISSSSIIISQENHNHHPSAGTMSAQSGMSSTEEEAVTGDNVHRLWKRKYHRHPKPDANAPFKPPSAYVMFSNDTRAELKQQNKSFTDLAKIIGDRWKSIPTEEKNAYERNALKAREEYLKRVEEYQKTEAFQRYQQYLSDFKAENEAAARPVGRPRKRPNNNNNNGTLQRQYPFYLLNAEDSNHNTNNNHNNTPSTSKQ
ncbi:hypothetical protein G6F46_007058 [Rhizopus delemar]|uniref:HMG box domain-containing protein n=2 Tax=Rhizopus TaxID=4842 RepID=A0A9P6Z330_9FUNG|nr:hypothetical protein G6F55_006416 [Rhizopus delemar]KAG1542612.1 hypothetical protein G6F51_007168 [Rhizopus arrhizus]KAG1496617.1 hypothetical protein G6F54_006339 [Rhizopus delemar]KAG1510350.1 hypothetical protein G6F53_006752 [Rhizopus delemar]KAG1520968.1 hypothetical protein G6F52_007165 [Rhizopus delemar]